MSGRVRPACPDDAFAVAEIHVASWQVAYRGIIPDGTLDDPALLDARRAGWTRNLEGSRHAAADPDEQLLVIEHGGRLTGFAGFGWDRDAPDDSERPGELYSCYLHPDTWGTGDADVLMAAARDGLRERFDRAVLWVLRDNPRARRFYERWGWSCGSGDEVEIAWWDGPVMPGAPPLDPPIAEVRYRIELG